MLKDTKLISVDVLGVPNKKDRSTKYVEKKGLTYDFSDERGRQWYVWTAPFTYESFTDVKQGYGVEKVNEGQKWMFENTDCLLITAKLAKDNIAVHKVAERTGCTVTVLPDKDYDDSRISIGDFCRQNPTSPANKKRPPR